MSYKRVIDPVELRKFSEVVYTIQRLVMSLRLPGKIKRSLITELQTVIEDFKCNVPEKQLKLILAKEIPSRIREFSQVFIKQLQLPLALSDEAREECLRNRFKELLDSGKIISHPVKEKDKFLHYLLERFNLRNFKKSTKHIPVNVRRRLSVEYRLTSDSYDRSLPSITGTQFVFVIKKIHGELERLERLYKLYKFVFECSLFDLWKQKLKKTSSLQEIFKVKNTNILVTLERILVGMEDPQMPNLKVKDKSESSIITVSSCECTQSPTPFEEPLPPSSSTSSFPSKCTIYPSVSSLITTGTCQYKTNYKYSIIK
ncbi:hypothetical protein O3M35_007194 [Rhynocoris fuscipes]|uniref:Uncharacterized protein n=1 Tax=Rhynocoris fuscipes TaxID=488301 RepID=A0AAW1DFN3_9HEMI